MNEEQFIIYSPRYIDFSGGWIYGYYTHKEDAFWRLIAEWKKDIKGLRDSIEEAIKEDDVELATSFKIQLLEIIKELGDKYIIRTVNVNNKLEETKL